MFKIAIDNGHGYDTPGKRTPVMDNGKQIREWEFNHSVAKRLNGYLLADGFETLMLSDTKLDTSLQERVKKANDWKADICISIHYNALDGKWGNQNGIETLYHPNSSNGKKLASLVQKHLIKRTNLTDRGIKARSDLYILSKTNMPTVLCECGFMDNKKEAALMLDTKHQENCALAILDAINEYFNREFILIGFNGIVRKVDGKFKDGTNYVLLNGQYIPVRTVAKSLGLNVSWDNTNKVVMLS